MIGNDDIRGLGLAARTVNEAGRAEEWAFTAQAIVARGGDHPARQRGERSKDSGKEPSIKKERKSVLFSY